MKQKKESILFSMCFLILVAAAVCSCSSSRKMYGDYNYFQQNLDSTSTIRGQETLIRNSSILKIQVISNSLNQEQVSLFNQPNNEYVVDPQGNIVVPLIGNVKAANYTRIQLQDNLQKALSSYIKSPVVVIRIMFTVNVLGEVRAPGVKSFNTEQVTVLDAISSAGDLTDFGKRQDVMVIREQNQTRKYYRIDLKNGDFFQSPAYYLQPNDVVYIGANITKVKMLRTNPTAQRNFQIFLSIVSVATTIVFLVRSFN